MEKGGGVEELKTLPRCHPALWQDTASLAERIVFSALYSAYASVGDSPDVSRRRLADHPRKEPAAGMNAGARMRRRSADPVARKHSDPDLREGYLDLDLYERHRHSRAHSH